MRAYTSLVSSGCGLLWMAMCPLSAKAFSYQPWIDGPERTLSILSIAVDAQDGTVSVNGIDTRAPETPFTVDWGDAGPTEDGFFELTHLYQDSSRNYVVQITAHYGDGTEDAVRTGVYFVAPQVNPQTLPAITAVSIAATDLELDTRMPYEPGSLTFMQDSCFGVIPRPTLEYLMSVGAGIQFDLVEGNVWLEDGGFRQVVLQDPSLSGGMYSLWYTTPVAFAASCAAMRSLGEAPSMLHEMGHNVTLNFPAGYCYGGKIDGNANAIYSETMAQIFAHATLYEMLNAASAYGLPPEMAADLEQQAVVSFGIVRHAYQDYVDQGARFCSWNDPNTDQDETLGTFMTIAYEFIRHAEASQQGLPTPVRKLSRFLSQFGPDWHSQYSQDTNSQAAESFRATLLVAALSCALDQDLREEFRSLHFPVDDAIFDGMVCEDSGPAGGGGAGGRGTGSGDAGGGGGAEPTVSGGVSGCSNDPSAAGAAGAQALTGGSTGGAIPQTASGGSSPALSGSGGLSSGGTTPTLAMDAGVVSGMAGSSLDPAGTAASANSTPSTGGAVEEPHAQAGSPQGGATRPAQGKGCSCHTPGSSPCRASFAWMLVAACVGRRAHGPRLRGAQGRRPCSRGPAPVRPRASEPDCARPR
ncbi:MAG: hypothetical protein JW940_14930 [Polyangiaceae bacterium]|nr:hypothetical protein [Polyangiaceae bacterium]